MDVSASMPLLISAAFGYLLGSIPFGLVLTAAAGAGDIRKIGSGNIGATNVLRTGKRLLAAATLVLDGGKAAAALLTAHFVFGQAAPYAGLAAGGAAFIGHCWPVWLKFKGGKGVATFFGLMLAGMPPVGAACALVWLMVAFVFRFSSLAALCATAAAPLFAAAFRYDGVTIAFAGAIAILIWARHHGNIAALLRGQERKIDLSRRAA